MVAQKAPPGVAQTTDGVAEPQAEDVAAELDLLRTVRSDEFIAAIIRKALAAGWSRNGISKETGMSRVTIREVLARTPEGV